MSQSGCMIAGTSASSPSSTNARPTQDPTHSSPHPSAHRLNSLSTPSTSTSTPLLVSVLHARDSSSSTSGNGRVIWSEDDVAAHESTMAAKGGGTGATISPEPTAPLPSEHRLVREDAEETVSNISPVQPTSFTPSPCPNSTATVTFVEKNPVPRRSSASRRSYLGVVDEQQQVASSFASDSSSSFSSSPASTASAPDEENRDAASRDVVTALSERTGSRADAEVPSSNEYVTLTSSSSSTIVSRLGSSSVEGNEEEEKKKAKKRAAEVYAKCLHRDLPVRYRDTPAYYCTYCSYNVCEACFRRVPRRFSGYDSSSSPASDTAAAAVSGGKTSPVDGARRGSADQEMFVSASAVGEAGFSTDWLNDLIAPPIIRAAHPLQQPAAPPPNSIHDALTCWPLPLSTPCHLCHRGRLVREEALLHEWCCEGPVPDARLQRGQAIVYDTANLQRYYSLRSQRETRLHATGPLRAQVLGVYPAALTPDEDQEKGEAEKKNVGRRENKRCVPSTGTPHLSTTPATRRAAAAAALHMVAATQDHAVEPSSSTIHPSLACCEEGGSFLFSVWNPGLDVPLVWCAVNREAREDFAAYRSDRNQIRVSLKNPSRAHDNAQQNSKTNKNRKSGMERVHIMAAESTAVSVTPLMQWQCPPSLPGLPARSYRVHVPYGSYAFGNVHALVLYVAHDLDLQSSVHDGRGMSVEVPPLLMVQVLHHIVSTPRPLCLLASQVRQDACRQTVLPPPPPRSPRSSSDAVGQSKRDGAEDAREEREEDGGDQQRCTKRARGEQMDAYPSSDRGWAEKDAEGDRLLAWPDGLASPELSLCVDHLLQGRSVAVYGVASKFFFLEHVIRSAELSAHGTSVVVIDASHGRCAEVVASSTATSRTTAGEASNEKGNLFSTTTTANTVGASSATGVPSSFSSDVRQQLVAVGQQLHRRTAPRTMTAADRAATARAKMDEHPETCRRAVARPERVGDTRTGLMLDRDAADVDANKEEEMKVMRGDGERSVRGGGEKWGREDAATLPERRVAAAVLQADPARSPAVARDDARESEYEHLNTRRRRRIRDAEGEEEPVSGCGSAQVRGDGEVSVIHVDRLNTFSSSSNHCRSSGCEPQNAEGVSAHLSSTPTVAFQTPQRGTVRELVPPGSSPNAFHRGNSSHATTPARRFYGSQTPLSQCASGEQMMLARNGSTRSAETPSKQQQQPASSSVMSPVPAFFAVLQSAVHDDDDDDDGSLLERPAGSVVGREGDRGMDIGARATQQQQRTVNCVELVDYAGDINFLRLPTTASPDKREQPSCVSAVHPDRVWCAPVLRCATEEVRQRLVHTLRRSHVRRRCVRWAALPSTAAAAQLFAQLHPPPPASEYHHQHNASCTSPGATRMHFHRTATTGDGSASAPLLLTRAHQTRPGWQVPLLLAVHNIDLLSAAEAVTLQHLCDAFAYPHPHLQLLVSFDDPTWPTTRLASSLARIGLCSVELRALRLPRVHEMRFQKTLPLLTELERAAAAATTALGKSRGAGSRKGQGVGRGRRDKQEMSFTDCAATSAAAHVAQRSLLSSTSGVSSNASGSSGGSSHLLNDTLRRVLYSLPPAFNELLRIVLDVQEEMGDGVFVSLFTITEHFEQAGVMVSQGRMKALMREMTSNRIARYDAAEHALMVPQVARLRRVLEEVMAPKSKAAV